MVDIVVEVEVGVMSNKGDEMDINKLTIGEARQLAAMFGGLVGVAVEVAVAVMSNNKGERRGGPVQPMGPETWEQYDRLAREIVCEQILASARRAGEAIEGRADEGYSALSDLSRRAKDAAMAALDLLKVEGDE